MFNGGKEISPLKPTISISIRMAIVLAFLLGMPLIALPQILQQLQGLLLAAQRELRPPQSVAYPPHSASHPQRTDENGSAKQGTTVTMLASDRPQPPSVHKNFDDLTATIKALKAQFVEAGVSYMVLERIGTDSVQYRFRFDMPVAAGSAYRKRFQVVQDAPDEAMRQALTELQQWRVAGRQPTHLERPTVILR